MASIDNNNDFHNLVQPKDKGHRLGNFHNYYTFNPCTNRIRVMDKLNMLEYLRTAVVAAAPDDAAAVVHKCINNGSDDNSNENDDRDNCRETKRLKTTTTTTATTNDNSNTQKNMSSKRSQPSIITYCDLGCNEGELTMSLSDKLLFPVKKSSTTRTEQYVVECLGLDIDETLINRANKKYKEHNVSDDKNSTKHERIHATFDTCNIAMTHELESKCQSFLTTRMQKDRIDLISIFSTTMWVHIHHGDEGLISLIQSICSLCNHLLIEPQPSKCYRNVNTRLRRMNLDEIDVSVDRLKMRCDIENEIEMVITKCGFERVTFDTSIDVGVDDDDDDEAEKEVVNNNDRTKWNRTLRLYKRKQK